MIRSKLLPLSGSAVLAAVLFLIFSTCMVRGVAAQTSSFVASPAFGLGYQPSGVATGNLAPSRNGYEDLVVGDPVSGNVLVYLGDGKGNFASGVPYFVGMGTSVVAVADMNGDHVPDVLVCNQTAGTISVLIGNGDGTLQPAQTYSVGFKPSFVATGNFGSGNVDVAVAGASEFTTFLNNGAGKLQTTANYSLSKTPTAIAAASFNNGSYSDLALANTDGTVSIWLESSTGQWSHTSEITVASGSLSSIVSGDFNGDGKTDLAVTQSGANQVSVLLGDGDGTFQSPVSYAVGNTPVSALVTDVNGDGHPDLVSVNQGSNTFSVLIGNGDGTLQNSQNFIVGNSPTAAVAGNFYGTGHVDLATINYPANTVSVVQGNGDGTFRAGRSYFSGGYEPDSIASGILGDPYGSKYPGLVVANYCGSDSTCTSAGSVSVFLANAKGVYQLSNTYAVGNGADYVTLADVNGDSKLDILAFNKLDNTVSVLPGKGDGSFGSAQTSTLAGSPIKAAVGDFNNDGKQDLAVLEGCNGSACAQAGAVEVLTGAGDGTFSSATKYAVGNSPTSIAVGDIRRISYADILASGNLTADVKVLVNDKAGEFTQGTGVQITSPPPAIALANLTGAGALDLVTVGQFSDAVSGTLKNGLLVLHGNGDGTFQTQAPAAYQAGTNPGSLVIADLNGNGNSDVVVADQTDSTVSVFFGNGDGTLQTAQTVPVGKGAVALTAIGSAATGNAALATANGATARSTEFSVMPENTSSCVYDASASLSTSTNASTVNAGVTLSADVKGEGCSYNPYESIIVIEPNDPVGGPVTVSDTNNGTTTADWISIYLTDLDNWQPGQENDEASGSSLVYPPMGTNVFMAVYSGPYAYYGNVDSNTVSVSISKATPTITLTASPSGSANANQQVTFTATFSGPVTPVTPAGTVTFYANSNAICTGMSVSTSNGVTAAVCTVSWMAPNTYSVTASYSGDSNFYPVSPDALSYPVSKVTTALNLSSSLNPSTFNTSVTFTAQLSGSFSPNTPQGSINFMNGGTPICSNVTLSNTQSAACTTSTLPNGTNQIVATYSGDSNFAAATSPTIAQNVGSIVTVIVSAQPNSSTVNTSVTLTATLQGLLSTLPAPQGTISFNVGSATGTSICNAVTVSNGGATCTTSSLPGGSDTIYATYSGDTYYRENSPGQIPLSVSKFAPSLTLMASPNSSTVNTSVTFTATLTGTFTPLAPSGSVSFTIGSATGSALCTGMPLTPSNGQTIATCTTSLLPAGASDSIVAVYSGDGNFATATSATLPINVNAFATSFSLGAAVLPPAVNSTVTIAATIQNVAGLPVQFIGTVAFTLTGNPISGCSAVKIGGIGQDAAACQIGYLTAGQYTIGATYANDNNYAIPQASATLTVAQLSPTLTLQASPSSPTSMNQAVTFSATFTGVTLTPDAPSQSVTFWAGANAIKCANSGDGVVKSGVATCTTSSLAANTYSVTASYPGDTNFAQATSNALSYTVAKLAPAFALTSSSSSNSSSVNASVTLTATLSTISGVTFSPILPNGTVNFTIGTASGTPICSTQPIVVGNSSATATCTTSTLPVGSDAIYASYVGDNNYTAAPVTITQTVGQLTPTITLTALPSPTTVNSSVTFKATLTAPAGGSFTPSAPTGVVNFTIGSASGTSICSNVNLNSSEAATCTVTSLPAGTNTINATYSGDSNFATSSGSVPETVQDFSIAFSAPTSNTLYLTESYSNTSDPFKQVPISVSITPLYGFNDNLQLTCSLVSPGKSTSVPGSTCSVSATPASSNSYTVTVTAPPPGSQSPDPGIGLFNVTVTATDTNPNLSSALTHQTPTPVAVYVVGKAPQIAFTGAAILATENVEFNTVTTIGASSQPTLGNFTCNTVVSASGGTQINNAVICSGSSTPASGTDETPVSITIIASGTGGAASFRAERSSGITAAAFLGVPILVLVGWLGRKKSPRENFIRFIALILMFVGVSYVTSCGGNFKLPSTPAAGGIPNGNYLIQMVATDQNKANYYAVVPLCIGTEAACSTSQ